MDTTGEVKVEAGQSVEIGKLAAALVAAQGEMTNPPKTKTVYAGQKKYSFAPLPEIIDAVRPVLTKHGLAVAQLVRDRTLETRLVHSSGQWMSAAYALPAVADSQAMGSAITYARRYSLCAILGIAGEDDEDGEAATAAELAEQEARRKEAEKNLDALKAKGQVRSAYDGKVLAPGEPTLPGERTGKVETTDHRQQTTDRKTGKEKAPSPLPFDEAQGRPSPVKGEGGKEEIAARSAPPTLKSGKSGRGDEGRGRQGAAGHTGPGEETREELAHSAGSGLAGIAEPLAELMKRDGITAEALKKYYVGKGHLPDTVEPSALPPDYVAGLTKPENWKKAVAAMRGKNG